MKNDQWFEPGDKVMRVSANPILGTIGDGRNAAPYGRVFCVEHFYHFPAGNLVTFIGVEHNTTAIGFIANNFRKVEEIRLCVEAVKRVEKTEEVPA